MVQKTSGVPRVFFFRKAGFQDVQALRQAAASRPSATRQIAATNLPSREEDAISGANYSNAGTIGYQLKRQVDRYQVMPGGIYWLADSRISTDLSPTTTFNKRVSLGEGSNCGNFHHQIIDPFATNTIYDYRNDTVNGIPAERYGVAPLSGC